MEVNGIRMVNIGKIRAVVEIRTSEGFIVKGFKVVEGENGLFVGMPSERTKMGKYIDTVKIEDPQLKEMVEQSILDYYNEKVKK